MAETADKAKTGAPSKAKTRTSDADDNRDLFLSENEKTLAEADELRAQGKLAAPEPIYIPNPALHPDADPTGQDQDTDERLEPVPDAILNPQKYLDSEDANDPAPEQSGPNDPEKAPKQALPSESSSSPEARSTRS